METRETGGTFAEALSEHGIKTSTSLLTEPRTRPSFPLFICVRVNESMVAALSCYLTVK